MKSKDITFDEDRLTASICRKSFFHFVKEFWHVAETAKPQYNWHIEYICKELQEAAERVFNGEENPHDLIINIPPGMTKSLIISILFPAWIWARMPHGRIISASHDNRLALRFSRKSRELVKSPLFIKLFGELKIKQDQDTKGYYENEKGGDRFASGMDGNVTGFHGHFILLDDLINPKETLSAVALETANKYLDETLPTRKVDKAVTLTILVMQRLHPDDPTGHMLSRSQGKHIKHICLPCDTSFPIKPSNLSLRYEGGLLDIKRLPEKEINKMKVLLGAYGFAGQFGQQPTPRDGGMFDTTKINYAYPPLKFKKHIRYWDKAATMDEGCFTCGAEMAEDYLGRFWLLDADMGQWNTDKREGRMKQKANEDGRETEIWMEVEGGSGGLDSYRMSVKNLAGFSVFGHKPTGSKEIRADPLAGQINGGNFYFRKDAAWIKNVTSQLELFPKSSFKDIVDAMSGGFAVLTGRVGRKRGSLF